MDQAFEQHEETYNFFPLSIQQSNSMYTCITKFSI